MFTNLEQINFQLSAWAGEVRRGASPTELASLRSRAQAVLKQELPQAYTQLLAKSNGVNFLFLSIYGTQAFKTNHMPTERIPGFIEANLKWRKRQDMPAMLVFGDTMSELHIYNLQCAEYQTIDSINGLPFERFADASEMFDYIMGDGLN